MTTSTVECRHCDIIPLFFYQPSTDLVPPLLSCLRVLDPPHRAVPSARTHLSKVPDFTGCTFWEDTRLFLLKTFHDRSLETQVSFCLPSLYISCQVQNYTILYTRRITSKSNFLLFVWVWMGFQCVVCLRDYLPCWNENSRGLSQHYHTIIGH